MSDKRSRKSKRKGEGETKSSFFLLSNHHPTTTRPASTETDPLLPITPGIVVGEGLSRSSREATESHHGGSLRSRHSSRSPSIDPSTVDPPLLSLLQPTSPTRPQHHKQLAPNTKSGDYPMNNNTTTQQGSDHHHHHHQQQHRQQQPRELPGGSNEQRAYQSTDSTSHTSYTPESPLSSLDGGSSSYSGGSRQPQQPQRHVVIPISRNSSVQRPTVPTARSSSQQLQQQQQSPNSSNSNNNNRNLPLLEIPEEVYTIRTSALQVLKPLTASWVCCIHAECCVICDPFLHFHLTPFFILFFSRHSWLYL